uniref:Uncharacterized protein n=1 Tax=viral metagenome TaxID=1070528 RepID=A0A6C0EUU8_9ZZZZ
MVKQSTFKLFSIQNIIGVLLAILILFDLKIENPIVNVINTPIGIIFSLVFVVILFICLNPIIGVLFLIYLFINIKQADNYSYNKNKILRNLNPPPETQVEEEVILNKAPIKNQNQGSNVSFIPLVESL